MTDREMLELAAKAAGASGLNVRIADETGYNGEDKIHAVVLDDSGDRIVAIWNPLEDDGDALRLAVACQLGISIVGGRAGLVECVSFNEMHCFVSSREIADDGDLMEATRRAITRAAAEIGRGM